MSATPILLVIIAMVSIQSGASMAKGLFPVLGPYVTSGLRLTFATLVMWLVFRPWKWKLSAPQIRSLAIYGACLGLMNLFFYAALERIPLGIAVALEFTGPLSVAVFSSKNKRDYLWALLAAIGIYLLVPTRGGEAGVDLLGAFYGVLAGAFWAGYILFGKTAGKEIHGGVAASWGMAFATATVLISLFALYLVFDSNTSPATLLTPHLLLMGVGVAVLSSALPYSLEMIAMKNIPTQTFGILMSLEPAIAALSGLLLLKEQLSLAQWSAIALVMISSAGSAFSAPVNHLPD